MAAWSASHCQVQSPSTSPEAIGLTVAVEVKAETNPEAGWWDTTDTINPTDDDALTWHLWQAAHDRVPLPRALVEIPAEVTEEEQ